ncbi:MAG: amidohydrolase [Ruminococcaceae bacterium]|nr:amidohydrolase [Oscillospiraceae bacterium]
MKLIKNAHIITMEKRDYENGYILIDGAKIAAIGSMSELLLDETKFDEVFDARGALALPGFIDAHCHIGLWEEGAGEEGADGNEEGEQILPQLRAIDGVNPADFAFSEALAAGVTAVVTGPGSGCVIGGQFAALKTCGNYLEEMLIKAPVALKVALGENPKKGASGKFPSTRMGTAALLRETLFNAAEYVHRQEAYEKNPEGERPTPDFKNEVLAQVIRRELPLKVHVHRADDICTAIRIAEEFNICITLEHCTEGHLLLPLLAQKKLPILLGPAISNRSKPELKNKTSKIHKALADAGIPFALITDHPEQPIQTLYLTAALVHQEGVEKRTALESITINAAKAASLADRIGSLAPGKDADIVIHRGELFTLDAKIEAVFVDGENAYNLIN